jgi:hypothetical protein
MKDDVTIITLFHIYYFPFACVAHGLAMERHAFGLCLVFV